MFIPHRRLTTACLPSWHTSCLHLLATSCLDGRNILSPGSFCGSRVLFYKSIEGKEWAWRSTFLDLQARFSAHTLEKHHTEPHIKGDFCS